ncbi:hypothetical protein AVEN_75666-1 [Araneus ventricosus]|uniref:Uncharacterized protein n=1 Tax=Araneus ventricosus TaxID=182803 RepID=A0A4Y2D6W9_ARAVE|nr:hypothetical protein AVEN_75666-1 [Araneus ventricosus]
MCLMTHQAHGNQHHHDQGCPLWSLGKLTQYGTFCASQFPEERPRTKFHHSNNWLCFCAIVFTYTQTDNVPIDGSCPEVERDLQIWCKDHVPNYVCLASVFVYLNIIFPCY